MGASNARVAASLLALGAVALGVGAYLRKRSVVPRHVEQLVAEHVREALVEETSFGDCLEDALVSNNWEEGPFPPQEATETAAHHSARVAKLRRKRVRTGMLGPAVRCLVNLGKGWFPNSPPTPEMVTVIALRLDAHLRDLKEGHNVRNSDRRELVARAAALVCVPDRLDLLQSAILASDTAWAAQAELASYRPSLWRRFWLSWATRPFL